MDKNEGNDIDFTADAETEATPDILRAIANACRARDATLKRLEALERDLATTTRELEWIEQKRLPELMATAGITNFTLNDGRKVGVEQMVYAGVTRDNLPAALAWLRRTGNDAIIRHTVGVRFGKGDDSAAQALAQQLVAQYGERLEVINDPTLHPSTLRAFVREQLRANAELPLELFGVRQFPKAYVKEPRS